MMSKQFNYSIVLIEYFSGQYLLDAIKSIKDQSLKPEKIVIVINGIDNSIKKTIEEEHSEIHVIFPSKNLGYAKAANLGIANTTSEFIGVLNPDLILDVDCAKHAIEFLVEHEDVGAVGPKIFEKSGEVYPSARNEPSLTVALGHAVLGLFSKMNRFSRQYKNLDLDNSVSREVDWLSGAAQFLRRSSLNEVGGWDEDFFMYCEDVDLGRRMRAKDWKNYYVPQSTLTHIQGGSSSKTPVKLLIQHHKSLFIFTKKKYSRNPIMKFATMFFIALRLPLALILSRRPIN